MQTPLHPLPNPSGRPQITLNPVALTEEIASLPSLSERTLRFFAVLTGEIPLLGGNPIIARLMQKMTPLFLKELRKLDQQQLDQMYQALLISLGQVYAPHAEGIVLNLRQRHLLVDEVAIALDDPLQDAPSLEMLTPPPPELPVAYNLDDDDVTVGVEVEIDGVMQIVGMKQSEYRKMLEAKQT